MQHLLYFLKSEGKFYPIYLENINWISMSGNLCIIYTDTRIFEHRITLTKMKDLLDQEKFVQISKKEIVNITKIEIYDPKGIILINNQEISVTRRFKKDLESHLTSLG